jgi:hypothetical protein
MYSGGNSSDSLDRGLSDGEASPGDSGSRLVCAEDILSTEGGSFQSRKGRWTREGGGGEGRLIEGRLRLKFE